MLVMGGSTIGVCVLLVIAFVGGVVAGMEV